MNIFCFLALTEKKVRAETRRSKLSLVTYELRRTFAIDKVSWLQFVEMSHFCNILTERKSRKVLMLSVRINYSVTPLTAFSCFPQIFCDANRRDSQA